MVKKCQEVRMTDGETNGGMVPLGEIRPKPSGSCATCGHEVDQFGRTTNVTKRGRIKGCGKPCPTCGWRRPRNTNANSLANLKPLEKGTARTKAIASKGARSRRRKPRISDLVYQEAEKHAEKVVSPYFAGLELSPDPGWSPSTKLQFYLNQTTISEKLFNRIEGTPVARARHVTADDDDVFPSGSYSPDVLATILAEVVALGGEDLIIDGEGVEDAEWVEMEE